MSLGSRPRPSAYVSNFSVTTVMKASGRPTMACRSATGPLTCDPSASVPATSSGAPSAPVSRHCPTELKFSSAKPAGSITRWQPAQGWFLRCNSNCARTVFAAVDAPLLLSSSEGTFGGGGGGGVFRKVLSTYFPRKTGEVLVATEVIARMLPCPSRPRRLGSVSFTLRNCGP